MKISINGLIQEFSKKITIKELKDKYNPESDIIIINGFPVRELERTINKNDELFFIQRGKDLGQAELEYAAVSRHTPGVYQKLKKATVGIAGLGGLGSNIAVALSRIGVGRLILADFDVVEPSNLNRQQFFMDQLGYPKTEALENTLKRINPYNEIKTFNVKISNENVKDIFKGCDLVIEAFDVAECKVMLIKELTGSNMIVIAASGMAGIGDNDSIITRKINDFLYIVGDFKNEAVPGRGLMAPRVMIAAAKQANLAVEIILEKI